MFECKFWFYSNEIDVDLLLYDVRWDIDDTEFAVKHNLNKSEIESKGILRSSEWRIAGKKMGFNLKCSIRGKMEANGTSSKYVEGQNKYIGIATWPKSITISSGDYALVYLYPTVPIACIYNSSYPCRLQLELFDFTEQFRGAPMYCNESILELTKPALCGLELDGWRRWGSTPLNISVPANSAQNQDYTALVKLRSTGLTLDPLWNDYHLPPIQITVVNDNITDDYWGWYYGYCSSSTDPYISTFDWNGYSFNDEGEFVLFRHKTKPIEVHTIQHKFNNSDDWTENCAVAVRAGRDVFIVIGCEKPTQWIIRRLNCEAGAEYLQVYYRWDKYEVHLPTGSVVSLQIAMNRRINVHVTLSRSDRDQVEGLCGSWNGNRTDDFMDRTGRVLDNATLSARSWRVPRAESLFDAKRRNETINLSYMYCACSDSTISNGHLSPNADCSWQETIPTCPPLYWDREPCQITRRERSTDDIDDDNEIDVPEDIIAHKEHTEANNEWKNGWNESSATDACMTYFEESPAYQACLTIDNLNITGEIYTCITNIRVSYTYKSP
ncbi:Hypothetical predicted protein [Mytilus galloprovincialis]|uniref:VWFD domain-containing protein n=1 Tax=Mytilus galloprovincialis TaxID=29158 RepID=A0A8B6EJB3_MYTGA|nr:Hypothetical predicted protein [Mytilus galloprovincialis]